MENSLFECSHGKTGHTFVFDNFIERNFFYPREEIFATSFSHVIIRSENEKLKKSPAVFIYLHLALDRGYQDKIIWHTNSK